MSSFGVLPEGFRQKTLDDILLEIQEAQRSAFGSTINTQADSVLGMLNGIYADQLSQLWEVALAVYRALYPDSASGEALDNVAAFTGAIRLAEAPSTVSLFLNLNAGTTLPSGRKVSIGNDGEQWQTLEDVTNAEAVQATVEVAAESVNNGAITGNAGTLDVIQTPVAGWTARAALDQVNEEPFDLANNQTLVLVVDEGSPQTVTFLTANFVDINAATAAEVATKINSATTGLTATAQDGKVRIQSDTDGSGSAIQVTGGTANPALGYPLEEKIGFNPSTSAKQTSGSNEAYTLANSDTLEVKVDGGSPQTVTFLTGDFVDITNATAIEVATKINSSLTGARAYRAVGKIRLESLTVGANSSIEVTGGTANPEFDFPETLELGESGDATPGRETESDSDFRLRREQLLRISGAATVEAIRSAVRDVDNVVQAYVFENETDTTDGDGLPPHSIEVVVSGGDDTEIAQTIFETKAAGIQTYRDPGSSGVTVSITDSQGFTHDIHFTRPTEIELYIEIDLEVDEATFGGGDQLEGEEQVKDALKALGDSLAVGEDVIINRFLAEPFTVTGVTDVTAIKIDDIEPPVGTVNFPVADRELALFSTARIVVNIT